MITAYQRDKFKDELQRLNPHDEAQFTEICEFSGYPFITTAGHGYLAIPRNDSRGMAIINKMSIDYGYKGRLAIYLEEDCEAPEFIKLLKEAV